GGRTARPRLERGAPRELASGLARCEELVLVRGRRGPKAGLEPRIDLPGLAARRNRRKPPKSSRQREQRQQEEIRDELDLETTHSFPSSPSPGCRWIP